MAGLTRDCCQMPPDAVGVGARREHEVVRVLRRVDRVRAQLRAGAEACTASPCRRRRSAAGAEARVGVVAGGNARLDDPEAGVAVHAGGVAARAACVFGTVNEQSPWASEVHLRPAVAPVPATPSGRVPLGPAGAAGVEQQHDAGEGRHAGDAGAVGADLHRDDGRGGPGIGNGEHADIGRGVALRRPRLIELARLGRLRRRGRRRGRRPGACRRRAVSVSSAGGAVSSAGGAVSSAGGAVSSAGGAASSAGGAGSGGLHRRGRDRRVVGDRRHADARRRRAPRRSRVASPPAYQRWRITSWRS